MSLRRKQNKVKTIYSGTNADFCHLEDDEKGKEDEHKEQQAAGVHRKKVVLVWEVRLRENELYNQSIPLKSLLN